MMRLPKNYFANLNAQRYREYLKLLPNLKNERNQIYTMFAFTFAALSFFTIFAINPTLSTIADLKKQLSDSKFVHQQLQTKINNLSLLQQKYTTMSSDLPYLYDAIPKDPSTATLLAQMQALSERDQIQLTSIRSSEVDLSPAIQHIPPGGFSYTFSLQALGSYDNLLRFATDLADINRIVTIELFSVTKDEKTGSLVLVMRGRGYFVPEPESVPTL